MHHVTTYARFTVSRTVKNRIKVLTKIYLNDKYVDLHDQSITGVI